MAFFRAPAQQAIYDAHLVTAGLTTGNAQFNAASQAGSMMRIENQERLDTTDPFTPAQQSEYFTDQDRIIEWKRLAIEVVRVL